MFGEVVVVQFCLAIRDELNGRSTDECAMFPPPGGAMKKVAEEIDTGAGAVLV